MAISTVGIVGGGLMGSGIAEVCARQGMSTQVSEQDADALAAARRRVERSLERGRATGKLSEEEVSAILERISFTLDLGSMEGCDIVIEAIAERLTDKVEVFQRLDRITPEHTILASNTSSLPIIEIEIGRAHV